MRSSSTAVVAAGMLFAASTVTAQTYLADTVQGCYKNLDNYVFNQTYIYNTDGSCQKRCAPAGYNAMATTKGTDCWCGNVIPADSERVDSTLCNVPCAGFGDNNCGGSRYWTVYLSGLVAPELVTTAGGSESTSPPSSNNSPSPTKTAAPSVVTVGGQTVVVTAGSSTSNSSSATGQNIKSSGPNKAAIAAGVVVGIVAMAAIVGGAFLFIRNKKRREVEEEYRRNAAVSSFIANGGKPPASSAGDSFNDTRLDPSVAQRRMSDGSIADNEDYSRRILKVTNA